MSALYFILLIGILIFVHELGHFLFAKWMGVRVLTFSIGFGPKLWSFERNGTVYQLSAFPLGGYVKMLGDDPTAEIPESEKADSLNSKPVWARFLIVFAGPLFNLLLPLPVFFFFGLSQGAVLPPVIGTVTKNGPAWKAGIRPGDKIVKLGDHEIDAWWQLQHYVSDNPERKMSVVVMRDGKRVDLGSVTPRLEYDYISQELDIKREVGRLNVTPYFLKPIVAIAPNSPAFRAGLRTWDRILAIDGKKIKTQLRFFQQLSKLRRPFKLTLLREVTLPGNVFEVITWELRTIRFTPQTLEQSLSQLAKEAPQQHPFWVLNPGLADLRSVTKRRYLTSWATGQGFLKAEMIVRHVVPGSAADKAGLKRGDKILTLNGREYPRWSLLRFRIRQKPSETHALTYQRGNRVYKTTLKLSSRSIKGELGAPQTVYSFGAFNRSEYVRMDNVPNQHRLWYASKTAWRETTQAVRVTILAMLRLFQGRISSKEIGGPILIYDIAGKTGERGWGYFFQVMVWISINLALINLLPIPLLDGGHIFFLLMEAIRRKPVSNRFREIASYIGFSILIFLMIFAFKNDIERNWDDIINFFR